MVNHCILNFLKFINNLCNFQSNNRRPTTHIKILRRQTSFWSGRSPDKASRQSRESIVRNRRPSAVFEHFDGLRLLSPKFRLDKGECEGV